jgi:GTP-binding protein
MAAPLDLRFVTSAPDVEHLPRTRAELALVGRSNVGKSSLLNALARRKRLAEVSKKPGRTKLLNCFELANGATVVDLPGYGYAASTSQGTRQAWRRRMERYLREREGLVLTLLLIDGEIGPTRLDLEVLDWLRAHDTPFQLVATKHDKVKSSRRERRKRDLARGCRVEPRDVIWVSAERGVGIDRLRTRVREALG